MPTHRTKAESTRTGVNVETLKHGLLENLHYVQGRSPANCTDVDLYLALAYAVRDRLLARYVKTVENTIEDRNARNARGRLLSSAPVYNTRIMPTIRLAAILLGAALVVQAAEPIRLFNGKDLSGWTHYLWDSKARSQDTATPRSAVWTVEDGILICKGRPTGYIRTVDEYENYRLEVEWRWPEGTTSGNNGVLIHTTTPNALGQWPKSLEVQLAFGNAGDFWVIGTTLELPNPEGRIKDRRHLNLTDNSEKPAGEWNNMVIVAKGDEVTVHVNGDLVNHGTKLSQSKGAIALQSEGALVHFRKVELTPLK